MALAAIIIAIVVAGLTMALNRRFGEERAEYNIGRPVTLALACAIAFAAAGKVPIVLAVLLTILLLAIMGYMIVWWHEDGSSVKELINFAIVDLLLAMVAWTTSLRIYDWPIPRWLVGIFVSLPKMVFVLSIGYAIANMFWFKAALRTGNFSPFMNLMKGGNEDDELDDEYEDGRDEADEEIA